MRLCSLAVAYFGLLLGVAVSQQSQTAGDQPKEANKKEQPSTAKAQQKRAETEREPEAKTAAAEPKQEPQKENPPSKEEHYDMTEVAPVVTHHQSTVAGKMLKYTATAGRLPIKRDDGKIEAEMFFVAYTLD